MRKRTPTIVPLILVILGGLFFFFFPPLWEPVQRSTGDYLFLAYLIGHGMWLYTMCRHKGEDLAVDIFRTPEVLFVFGSALFLFTYIFAINANLTYAQLFAQTNGNFSLAPNSRIQRLDAVLRFLPFLLYDGGVYLFFRIKKPGRFLRLTKGSLTKGSLTKGSLTRGRESTRWSMVWAIVSGILYSISLPSFLSVDGFGLFSFFALIPLWFVLLRHSTAWGIFYGLTFVVFQSLLSYFWLGTFSLITLQLATVFLLLEYLLFFLFVLPISRRLPLPHVWFFPMAWVLFDFVRTQGFLGYPWGMLGTGLYRAPSLIQIADIGGIYMVSLFVLLTNGLLLELGVRLFSRPLGNATCSRPAAALGLLWLFVLVYGFASIYHWEKKSPEKTVRIALIQQNTDPRKHDYRRTFDILKRLTEEVLPFHPDLIAWSETAFVPNIRKWGSMDPDAHILARLVHDFHEFQRSTGSWLLTGNDDYEETVLPDGSRIYSHYNAAVLFSPEGKRIDTYRKLHLVPFSEYFPYSEEMPWVADVLQGLDQDLWEKGDRPVVFRHPEFSFITPICFEDSFPGEIRRATAEGADVILNLSNDYWSLTEVEGQQHFANSLFRSIENRRPLLRSTASGMTAHVSPTGRILKSLPYYQEGVLTTEVSILPDSESLYLRRGNWIIAVLTAIMGIAALFAIFDKKHSRLIP